MTGVEWRWELASPNSNFLPEVPMFKRILVALDGSAASNAGLKSAIQLAIDQQATLLALHVVDNAAVAMSFEGAYVPTGDVDSLYKGLLERGRATLAKAETAARNAGADVKPLLVETRGQTVAHAILGQAQKTKADLIVLGTHGRRGLSRVLMGSDAEAVVREARVPVLLVRARERKARKAGAAAKPAAPATRSRGAA